MNRHRSLFKKKSCIDEDELKEGLHFGIQYIDSMRNEYIQEYDMKKEYSSIKIECGYPGFLEQF